MYLILHFSGLSHSSKHPRNESDCHESHDPEPRVTAVHGHKVNAWPKAEELIHRPTAYKILNVICRITSPIDSKKSMPRGPIQSISRQPLSAPDTTLGLRCCSRALLPLRHHVLHWLLSPRSSTASSSFQASRTPDDPIGT